MIDNQNILHTKEMPKPGSIQNLPLRLPADTNTLNWGQKGNLAPTEPPMYYQPG